jgi:hypothetical protein
MTHAMPDNDNLPLYRPNPHYGKGVFRRRIRLDGQPGVVVAELEDDYHGFRSRVYHDGSRVIDIQAQAIRIPMTTCDGATRPIRALIDMPLATAAVDISHQVNPRANCTHLYDLTLLAIAHARRGITVWQYDVSVGDELDQPVHAIVQRNGKIVLDWLTQQRRIQQPLQFAGNSLHKGFTAWATQAFSGDEREAAFVLQKGYFVAQARAYDIDRLAGTPVNPESPMIGVCYTYSADVVVNARRTGNKARDFSDCPEQLLKFV